MIYLQPRRKSVTPISFSIRVGALCVALLGALSFFLPQTLQGIFQSLAYPLWKIEAGIRHTFEELESALSSKNALLAENHELQMKYRGVEHLLAREELFRRENTELKGLLGRSVKDSGLLSAILARPPRLSYDTLILDVGFPEKVEVGDRVYISGDVAVGDVTAVYLQTSLVTLYSTPGRENDVRVGTTTARAIGRGLGNFLIELPREFTVATGTPVTLPGLTPSLLGIVEEVEAHSADPVAKLYVRSPYSLSDVGFVMLLPRHDSIPKTKGEPMSL